MNFKIHYFKKETKLQYKLLISLIQFIEYLIVIPFLFITIIIESLFWLINNLFKIRFIYQYLDPIRMHRWFLAWRLTNKLLEKWFKFNK